MTDPDTHDLPTHPVGVLAVIWAPWALPGRPAPVVLQELTTRLPGDVLTLGLSAEPLLLDRWSITSLPTWLWLVPGADGRITLPAGPGDESAPGASGDIGADEDGCAIAGQWLRRQHPVDLLLFGDWAVGSRLEGAASKTTVWEFWKGASESGT